MERAEKIGLGVASAGHVLLFALLSTHWLSATPIKLNNNPMEVSIADDVALQSAARKIAETPPPPTPAETEGPPEQAAPAPSETSVAEPEPVPTPAPAPQLKPAEKPKPTPRVAEKPKPVEKPKAEQRTAQKARPEPKKAEAKPSPVKSKSADKGDKPQSRGSKLTLNTSDWSKSNSPADVKSDTKDGAQASSISAAQKSALDAEIRRQLKPHWKAPTGADVESLRTIVTVRLGRDGSIVGNPEVVDTVGVTASNSTQVRLHQEQAIKAVRLAAPFRLPADLYSGWSFLRLTFDRRL